MFCYKMVLFQMVAVKNLFGCILKWFCQIKVRFLERLVFNLKNISKIKDTKLWRYARVEIFQNSRMRFSQSFHLEDEIRWWGLYIERSQVPVAYLGQWHFRKKTLKFQPKKKFLFQKEKFQSVNEIKGNIVISTFCRNLFIFVRIGNFLFKGIIVILK